MEDQSATCFQCRLTLRYDGNGAKGARSDWNTACLTLGVGAWKVQPTPRDHGHHDQITGTLPQASDIVASRSNWY